MWVALNPSNLNMADSPQLNRNIFRFMAHAAVEARPLFNPIEFDGIKIGVVELFPDTKKLNGVAITEPVLDEVVGAFGIAVASNVRQADVIRFLFGDDTDGCAFDFDGAFLSFAHGACFLAAWVTRYRVLVPRRSFGPH